MGNLANAPVTLWRTHSNGSYKFSKFFPNSGDCVCSQVDRGLRAEGEGDGESGCVLPQVQLPPV